MPVFQLTDELRFPDPALAEEGGLLAIGGDLQPSRLVLAYSRGIFPWYSEGRPILWWCPSPRLVLRPSELEVNRTLRKILRRGPYRLTMDQAFEQVIDACASMPRADQDGTWITNEMRAAYVELHHRGLAHSVEAWADDELAGGLYGLSLGGMFFGESMFTRQPNASKIAFASLVRQLEQWSFDLVDCQVVTEHMVRFGARELELQDFLDVLHRSVRRPTRRGEWAFELQVVDGSGA